jgi:hypothetical protein
MGFEPVHVRARFDGHTFVPEAPVDVPEGTILEGWLSEQKVEGKAWVKPGPGEPRKPGSAKGLIWMSDDFDDPLEDFAEYV